MDSLRETLDRLFPGQFLPPREEGNFVVAGPVPAAMFAVQCSVPGYSGFFEVQSVPGPYCEVSDFLGHLSDAVLRETAASQECFLSVDLIGAHNDDDDPYRFIGALLAQLAPPDAAVLVHPTRYTAVSFTEDTRRLLAVGGAPFGHA